MGTPAAPSRPDALHARLHRMPDAIHIFDARAAVRAVRGKRKERCSADVRHRRFVTREEATA